MNDKNYYFPEDRLKERIEELEKSKVELEQIVEDCNICDDDYVNTITRLSELLTGVAIAVKGPEPELTQWSWHDLPDLVEKLKNENEVVAKNLFKMQDDIMKMNEHHAQMNSLMGEEVIKIAEEHQGLLEFLAGWDWWCSFGRKKYDEEVKSLNNVKGETNG